MSQKLRLVSRGVKFILSWIAWEHDDAFGLTSPAVVGHT